MKKIIISGLISVMALTGCATQIPGANQYNSATAGVIQQVTFGTVLSVRNVQLDGKQSGVGGLAGAGIGGIAGNQIGGGSGKVVMTILGVVGGAIVGNAIEGRVAKSEGIELTIKTDTGQTVAVAQTVNPNEAFKPKDRVKIVGSGNNFKISRI